MRSVLLASLCALLACDPKDPETTDTAAPILDEDGDGYTVDDGDCDDNNSLINPSVDELCDGFDNNCDGSVDEDVTTPYYEDGDGDGFGNDGVVEDACQQPSGYVPNGNDCDDDDAGSFPGNAEVCDEADNNCDGAIDEDVTTAYYADADSDGYGDAVDTTAACEQPSGYVLDDTDCDDASAAAYPGAEETCDEADNNCDGTIDEDVTTTYYVDADGDLYGVADKTTEACALPGGYTETSGDCDDGAADINPDAAEICDDIDNDCDGLLDDSDDSIDASTQAVWYADGDGDSYGDAAASTLACDQPSGYVSDNTDCDDSSSSVNPGAAEVCDGVYNDCDDASYDAGSAPSDELDGDGDRYVDCAYDSATWAGASTVLGGDDCDDADATVYPAASESCDGIYNDCDDASYSASDAPDEESDLDGDGYVSCAYSGSTWAGDSAVVGGEDCDDDDPDAYPNAIELCDGYFNDCEHADYDASSAPDEEIDDDGDGYIECVYSADSWSGDSVDGGEDCDDDDATAYPGAEETCDDVDNNCDGDTDEGTLGLTTDCPAYSCLEIIEDDSSATDDSYYIDPDEDGSETEVYCDMTTDAGGYTYYKVDYGSAVYAYQAETYCETLGMQLFVPRTADHLQASLDVAYDSSIGSSGTASYMYILGIYPTTRGNTCTRTAFNSGSCTGWAPFDGGPYYVGTSTGITEPNGDNGTTSSMYYSWSLSSGVWSISWYNDINYPGYSSRYFMCQVGDKWGDGVDRGD